MPPLPTSTPTQAANRGLEEADLVKFLRLLYDRAKAFRRNRLPNWTRNWQLVNNRFGAMVSEPWMPNPRSSEIYPIGSTFVAWLSDQSPAVSFAAAADPSAAQLYNYLQTIAGDLTTVYQSTWDVLDFAYQLKLGFWDCFTWGVGLYKSTWDQALDAGQGNINLARIHPWSLYLDPKATSFDDADYIIEARRMSLEEVDRRYPGHRVVLDARAGTGEIDDPPRSETLSGPTMPVSNLAPPYGGNMMGLTNSQTQARGKLAPHGEVVVYEFWLKTNDEWWEGEGADSIAHVVARWRVVVVSQGEVLLDEWADELWSHAGHPYDRFVFDDVGEFYGIAMVDHLAYPQIYVNRLLTAYQLNTELTGNPVLLEPENSLTSRVNWTNKPGQRLPTKGGGAQGSQPSWLTPPTMSADVIQLIEWWKGSMSNVSGLTDAMKQANSRTAQGVSASAQEPTFVRIRAGLSNLEKTLKGIASKHADLIIDNYTDPRIVAITGPTGEQSAIALRARHFSTGEGGLPPFRYSISVDAGSQLPTSLAGRIARELQLFQMHVTDDQAVLDAMRYPNTMAVLKRKYEKIQAGLAGGGGGARQARAGNTPAQYQQGART